MSSAAAAKYLRPAQAVPAAAEAPAAAAAAPVESAPAEAAPAEEAKPAEEEAAPTAAEVLATGAAAPEEATPAGAAPAEEAKPAEEPAAVEAKPAEEGESPSEKLPVLDEPEPAAEEAPAMVSVEQARALAASRHHWRKEEPEEIPSSAAGLVLRKGQEALFRALVVPARECLKFLQCLPVADRLPASTLHKPTVTVVETNGATFGCLISETQNVIALKAMLKIRAHSSRPTDTHAFFVETENWYLPENTGITMGQLKLKDGDKLYMRPAGSGTTKKKFVFDGETPKSDRQVRLENDVFGAPDSRAIGA